METIVTPRLLLRPAKASDAEALFAIFSDPLAMRYWDTLLHTSRAQTEAFLKRMIDADPEATLDLIIEHQGVVIGKAGMWRQPEVGFILSPAYWGKGFAREALSAVIARAFAKFDLPALVAEADPRNAASLGLLKRLGFVETHRAARTIKVGEEWCDSVYLELKRSL